MEKTKQQRGTSGRRNGRKRSKRVMTRQSYIVLAAIIIFVIGLLVLIQHAIILKMDNDVRNLQSTLEQQQAVNDSKEGQLVSSQNLATIEATARGYGMTEPATTQYVYVTLNPDSNTSQLSAGNKLQQWWASVFKKQ